MTDTDTNPIPEASAPVKHDLTPADLTPAAVNVEPAPEPEAVTEPAPEPVDYFATYDLLRAGETLQLLKMLEVEESQLAKTGTPQLLAVVWKHERIAHGISKMSELVDLTEKELLARLNLTEEEYVKQVTAYINRGSKS